VVYLCSLHTPSWLVLGQFYWKIYSHSCGQWTLCHLWNPTFINVFTNSGVDEAHADSEAQEGLVRQWDSQTYTILKIVRQWDSQTYTILKIVSQWDSQTYTILKMLRVVPDWITFFWQGSIRNPCCGVWESVIIMGESWLMSTGRSVTFAAVHYVSSMRPTNSLINVVKTRNIFHHDAF
jgi:hypothetical protein